MSQLHSPPVITMDGPSGSGKGTLSQRLANRQGWHLLNSGAIYRITALQLIKQSVDLSDTELLKKALSTLDIHHLADSGNSIRYYLNSEEVTQAIRSTACSEMASKIAAIPMVRSTLYKVQREFLKARWKDKYGY